MARSDIFDEYAKLAEAKGLVKLAEESAQLKKYKSDPYPRVGSDDISTIEALYGVKPDSPIKYKHNIMEAAHPKAVVIAPSYDKLNGLVENEIERQNIDLNIVQTSTTGKNVTQGPKYAHRDLMLQLVRIANDMDNQDVDELRALADVCLENLKKKADWSDWLKEKGGDIFETGRGAGTGAVIGGIAGGVLGAIFGEGIGAIPGAKGGAALGAALGGIVAALGKTTPQVRNISENARDLSSQIEDIKNKIPPSSSEFKFLEQFQMHAEQLGMLANKYNALISDIQNKHEDSSSEDARAAAQTTQAFLVFVKTVDQDIANWSDRVQRHVYDTYVGHSKLLSPLYEFIDDDIEDVTKSITSFQHAVTDFENSLESVKSAATAATSQPQAPQVVPSTNTTPFAESPYGHEEPQFDNMDLPGIAKALGREPSEQDMKFFKFLMEDQDQ